MSNEERRVTRRQAIAGIAATALSVAAARPRRRDRTEQRVVVIMCDGLGPGHIAASVMRTNERPRRLGRRPL